MKRYAVNPRGSVVRYGLRGHYVRVLNTRRGGICL